MADNRNYADRSYNNQKRRKRIEEEEKELEALLKKPEENEQEEQEAESEETQEEPTKETKVEKGEVEEKEDLSPEEKTFKKRYGDLRRHLAKKEEEYKTEIERLKKSGQKIQPPASEEELEAWAKKYPEVAGIVNTIAEKKAKELFGRAEERLQKLDDMQYETTRRTAEQKIRDVHPDFDELRDSTELHDWVENQAKWVQDALYENFDDPDSVIAVFDLYKFKTGKTPQAKNEKRKETAKHVKTSSNIKPDLEESGKKFRESVVNKMTDKEFEENQEAIIAAMKNGNFIYDMTGAAR